LQVVDNAGFQIRSVAACLPFHIIVVATKPVSGGVPDNQAFLGSGAKWKSPFSSDAILRVQHA
jgi:hypothetical protein